jgi:hypothetical protein
VSILILGGGYLPDLSENQDRIHFGQMEEDGRTEEAQIEVVQGIENIGFGPMTRGRTYENYRATCSVVVVIVVGCLQ